MSNKLATSLSRSLGVEFNFHKFKTSRRSLYLTDLGEDFQFGVAIDPVQKSGVAEKILSIGVRIPSLEAKLDEYEMHQQVMMGMPNPEQSGWLTVYDSLTTSADFDFTSRPEIKRIFELVSSEVGVRGSILSDLDQFVLPSWSSSPQTVQLAIRVLIMRYMNAGSVSEAEVDQIIRSSNADGYYSANVKLFYSWLIKFNS